MGVGVACGLGWVWVCGLRLRSGLPRTVYQVERPEQQNAATLCSCRGFGLHKQQAGLWLWLFEARPLAITGLAWASAEVLLLAEHPVTADHRESGLGFRV